jgi:hypothetical protein
MNLTNLLAVIRPHFDVGTHLDECRQHQHGKPVPQGKANSRTKELIDSPNN